MLRKFFTRLLCTSFALAMLTSCGEEDIGGGIGEFTTVNADASASTLRLESDVRTGNDCSGTAPTGGTFATDSVDFNVTSNPQVANALDLKVSKVTISYAPDLAQAPGTPPLPTVSYPLQVLVAPGVSAPIPVTVMTDLTKFKLVTDSTLPANIALCSADYFQYHVTVTFEVSEIGGSGKVRNISAYFTLALADRV